MRYHTTLPAALLLAACTATGAATPDPHAAIDCHNCERWNRPVEPFRLHGSSWYVGPAGVAVVMIETAVGLLLFDAALPQSLAQIEANLNVLGHRLDEIRWILVSHAHYDHIGGLAALQQASGARIAASPAAAAALRLGDLPADDPQATHSANNRFAAVSEVTEIADGGTVTLGGLSVTAHHTPGHTPGGSSWSWSSCEDGDCVTAVYADSLTAVSADGFRFSDDPSQVAAFERSIERIAALGCPLLVATHPEFSGLFEQRERAERSGNRAAFIAPGACRGYAGRAAGALRQRLAQEAASGAAP